MKWITKARKYLGGIFWKDEAVKPVAWRGEFFKFKQDDFGGHEAFPGHVSYTVAEREIDAYQVFEGMAQSRAPHITSDPAIQHGVLVVTRIVGPDEKYREENRIRENRNRRERRKAFKRHTREMRLHAKLDSLKAKRGEGVDRDVDFF